MNLSRGDLVCLHLLEVESVEDGPAPRDRSAPGICDVVGDGLDADRLDVLSTLDRLVNEGYLEAASRPVAGRENERTVYTLTAEGRERAAERRSEVAEETITLRRDGTETTVPLEEVASHLDVESPLITALIERDSDGVVELGDASPGEPLIERERELDLLETVVWRSHQGPAGAVVTGPTGIGKTSLTSAVADRVREAGGRVLTASADCDAAEPFGLVRELLESAADDADSPFAAVDGVDPDADSQAYEAGRNALFYDVLERFRSLGDERRTVLVLEDLEHATAASLDFLSYLLEHLEEAELGLVCTCTAAAVDAPDRVADGLDEIVDAETVARVDLDPLSRDGVAAYVRRLLGTDSVPSDFLERIYERTEGNPLFVTALVRHVETEGVVDPDTGSYPANDAELELPDTIRAVIDARLESLADERVSILEAAAVVGERVSLPVLARVIDRPETELRDAADAFVDSELCERAADASVPLSRTFRFRNPVIREALRERIGDDRRVELHERAARAVLAVELTDGRTTHRTAARHFERAGEEAEALDHYWTAGDRAFDVFAHDAALEAYERALALARSLERTAAELELREAIADVERVRGEYDGAGAAYRTVLDRAETTARRQRAYRKLAELARNTAAFDRALSLAEDGLALADDPSADDGEIGELLHAKGNALLRLDRYDEALATFERLEALAEEHRDANQRTTAVHGIGLSWLEKGDLERAEPFLREAIDLAEETGQQRELGQSYGFLGALNKRRNEYDAALSCYERARDHYEEIGDVRQVAICNNNCGVVYRRRGDAERALEEYRRARETARRIGETYLLVTATQNIASIHLRRGDLESFRERLSEAASEAEGIGSRGRVAYAAYLRAQAAYYEGSIDRMTTAVERLHEVAREIDDKRWLVRATGCRGMLARLETDHEAADARHREAIDLANRYGLDEEVVEHRLEQVLTCAVRDDLEGARDAAGRVATLATESDAATAALARGVAARLAENYATAAEALETARQVSTDRADRLTAFRAREQQARLALARDDAERARAIATDLEERAAERGLELFVDRARRIRTAGG